MLIYGITIINNIYYNIYMVYPIFMDNPEEESLNLTNYEYSRCKRFINKQYKSILEIICICIGIILFRVYY